MLGPPRESTPRSMPITEAFSESLIAHPVYTWTLLIVAVQGFAVNHHSDAILRRLRKPGETGYKIPYGGFYRWVSSPNYFGELVEWFGFALAAWTVPAIVFALFTASNLVPRAFANHRWYIEHFSNYPKDRRRLIIFVL